MKARRPVLFALLPALALSAQGSEPILLQWGEVDTSAAAPPKGARAFARKGADANERGAWLVQFEGAVTEEWREWLEGATQVRGYIPEDAYLVWATAAEMEAIAAHEGVRWTGEWRKEYRTVRAGAAPVPAARGAAAKGAARWMRVCSFLAGPDGAEDLRARLAALGAEVRGAFPRLDGCCAVARLTDAQVDEAAGWADVEWIEPRPEPRLFNDRAALPHMMNVAPAWAAVGDGGLGLTGRGQIVAVADTGCDLGSLVNVHEDLAGRIVAGYGWRDGVYDPTNSWADADAHGTHVCGSVLGNGARSGGLYRGMAWEAGLVMQGCAPDLNGLPDDFQDLLSQARGDGARIHSDSWGYGSAYAGDYIYDAISADEFMWANQDFLAVIAAGNDGIDADKDGVIDPGSVCPPGTAKNCVCVGAAENDRDDGGYSRNGWGEAWPSDYPAEPIASDKISSTSLPRGLAAFSGRGPTRDGRLKPDVVAPGTDVVSIRSRAAEDYGWGLHETNESYMYEGGTSMATPLVAGTLALVRQWLCEERGMDFPPAALMKAILVAGARDMSPGQYGSGQYREIFPRPDRSQGFGHVDLVGSLVPGEGAFLSLVTNRLTKTGASYDASIDVGAAGAGRYVLALVWQDYPGSSGAAKALVNDLDLSVIAPSGEVLHPNRLGEPDRLNNVELVEFEADEPGAYAVKVRAHRIAKVLPNGGGQPFALVMRGPVTSRVAFASPDPAIDVECGEEAFFDFGGHLASGAWPLPAFALETDVPADLWTFDDATGELYFHPDAPGVYEFACTAAGDDGSDACTLAVSVRPNAPADVFVARIGRSSFTVRWSPVAGADSYRADVAPFRGECLPGLSNAVVSATFLDVAGLEPSTTYSIRIRAVAAGLESEESGSAFATTTDEDVPPAWEDFPSAATVNLGDTFRLDLVDYLSGSPEPDLRLEPDGVPGVSFDPDEFLFSFAPAAAGVTVFSFSASNALGTAAAAIEVTAVAEAPAIDAIDPVAIALGGEVDLFLSATGAPRPVLSVACAPGTDADFRFDPATGEFFFVPAAAGTYAFTVSAANSLGTATLDFSVEVGPRTVPALTISDVTPTNALAAWTACDGAAGYELRVCTNGVAALEIATNAAVCTIAGLRPNTSYRAEVRAAEGDWSPSVWFLTPRDGAAPSWSALPEPRLEVGDRWAFRPADFVSGDPVPVVRLDDPVSIPGELYSFDGETFRVSSVLPGVFDFRFVAANRVSTVPARLAVVIADAEFDRWLARHGAAGAGALDLAPNGRTYYEDYVADIDPASADFLSVGSLSLSPTGSWLTVRNASPDRWYQLLGSTNLAEGFVITNDLGWGAGLGPVELDGLLPDSPGWFGRLRVLLAEPED